MINCKDPYHSPTSVSSLLYDECPSCANSTVRDVEIEAAAALLDERGQCDFINGARWADANPSPEVLALVEACEFYASNFRSDVYVGPTKELLKDFGKRASAALSNFQKSRGGK